MSAVEEQAVAGKNLVVGLGATGLSVARYLKRNGIDAAFVDTREAPPGIDALNDVWPDADVQLSKARLPKDVDRVIVSPGVPDDNELLKKARRKKLEIVSDIELFAREAKAPFVAVTGSNGKSTVTTLIYHMCRAAGRKVLAGGNLGEPALDLLAEETPDLYVLELSSFQLQRTAALPAEVAVLLNVAPDHLDWHADEEQYREAKYRIYREARAAVVNRTDSRAIEAASSTGAVISFGMDPPEDGQYGMRRDEDVEFLARGEALLLASGEMAMNGVHNRANALAALAAGELLGLPMPAMLQVISEFPGLPHRMQFVARKGAVDFIDDSKATNVAAAIAAIGSVAGSLVLIAGGDGKGGDFTPLADVLDGKLRAAVLIGKDAESIADALGTFVPVFFAADMVEAVTRAADCAESDDTVLLAPACASTDQFANYAARGDAFRAAVETLR
jgi:UDP-N-acetylmuramoylalanine--D-glutamate ligase